jgi:hypothetical protein
MADVVFSAFDEKRGPVAIFSSLKDEILTKKIAVKSIVSTLTNLRASSAEGLEGEAIIPFPDENLIAFILYSSLDQKTGEGENRVISLCLVVPSDQSTHLYTNATKLSQEALQIKAALNREFTFGQPVSQSIISQLKKWGTISESLPQAAAPATTIIAEKEIRFTLKSLFELFPVKKGIRTYEDPLEPFFIGLLQKIPVIVVGPNVEFLLEVTDLFRELMPDKDLDVRLSVGLREASQIMASKIPRADIILLDERQNERKTINRDPVVVVSVGRESRFLNYIPPDEVSTTFEKVLKKARDISDEMVAKHYLKGEFLSFNTKLSSLKEYCLSGRRGKVKEIAKTFNVKEEYMYTLAEAIRVRMDVTAEEINGMFQNTTDFQKMELQSTVNVGFVR